MAKVYVVQRPAFRDRDKNQWVEADLTPAEHFGRVEVLLPPGNLPRDPAMTVENLRAKLMDFRPDEDFLVLAGDPVAIAIASVIATRKGGSRLRLLKWDRIHQCYVPYEVPL